MAGSARSMRRSRLYAYVASISFTTFVVGFALGFSSPALPDLRSIGVLSEQEASWFASLLTVGGMIGSFIGSFTIDKFGRRGSLQIADVLFIVSFGMICGFDHVGLLLTARVVGGIASGLALSAAPAYISEISTNELRGVLGSCTQLAIVIGIACSFMVAAAFSASYVTLSGVGCVAACIGFLALFPLFDSPRWYLARRYRHQALAALVWLRGSSESAESELSEIGSAPEDTTPSRGDLSGSKVQLLPSDASRSSEWRLSELCTSAFCRPLTISVGLMVIQQFSGINAILFYANDILSATQSDFAERFGGVMIALAQVIATVVAASLMERAGRKQLLRTSLLIMGFGCFLLGMTSHLSINSEVQTSKIDLGSSDWSATLAVGALLIYIVGFSIGCGPIPMIIMSEIFDTRHRAVACGATIFANWLFGFIMTLFFGSLAAAIGRAGVYVSFGCVCLGGVVFAWRCVPETRGKTLEEIQLFFNRK